MNFLKLFTTKNVIGAHRGARLIAPENTMRALKASVGHCDFIEVDVQLSREGVPIIMHDDTLERTTNVAELEAFKGREPYKVCDFSFAELSSLDYGSWFDGRMERLLTLSETLKFVRENNLFINIEIKDMQTSFSDIQVVLAVLKEVQEWQVQNRVLISSFWHEYLVLCKERMPKVPTAALVEGKHPENLIRYLTALHVDAYHINDALADAQTLKKLTQAGFIVNVYTVNDEARQKELFAMGVNGVFADRLVHAQI